MLRVFCALVCLMAGLDVAHAARVARTSVCHISGFESPLRCVSFSLPLDYARPNGEQISLSVVIAPSVTARPAVDPLFVFAGGPGQAASGMGSWLNSAFEPTRQHRDIVLFDIRGTGLSSPLKCSFSLLSLHDGDAALRQDAQRCAAQYGDRVKYFSSVQIVQDIERVRAALGYSRINLWGGSFGTRVAQHYARAFPERTRAVILDAATPATETILSGAAITGQRALDRLFSDCAAQATCRKSFPTLLNDTYRLLGQAERSPIRARIVDPRSGIATDIMIDRDGVAGAIRGALYVGPTRNLVPFAVQSALSGRWEPLVALVYTTSEWSTDTMSVGSMLSILCAEDVVRAQRQGINGASFGFMKDAYFRTFMAACGVWPRIALPDAMFAEFRSKIPALAISGEIDPVTPPSSGEAALKFFARSGHIVIPSGFHTNSSDRCVSRAMAEFLNFPERTIEQGRCTVNRPIPRFMTGPNF